MCHLDAYVFRGDATMRVKFFRQIDRLKFVFDYPGDGISVETKRFIKEVPHSRNFHTHFSYTVNSKLTKKLIKTLKNVENLNVSSKFKLYEYL